jgi:hypothetical protein
MGQYVAALFSRSQDHEKIDIIANLRVSDSLRRYHASRFLAVHDSFDLHTHVPSASPPGRVKVASISHRKHSADHHKIPASVRKFRSSILVLRSSAPA